MYGFQIETEKEEVLDSVLKLAREPVWKPFQDLVDILVCLEDAGLHLQDSESRSFYTHQFIIQKRILDVKKKFLKRSKKNIEKLSSGVPFDVLPVIMDGFNSMFLYNKYHLYHGKRKGKIDLNYFEKLIYTHGVLSYLSEGIGGVSSDSLKFAQGCSFIVGRNFTNILMQKFNINFYDAKKIVKQNPFYLKELLTKDKK